MKAGGVEARISRRDLNPSRANPVLALSHQREVPLSNANIAHVQSMYAAFGGGDVDALIGGMTQDVDWETIGRQKDFPTLGPRKGAAQVRQFF